MDAQIVSALLGAVIAILGEKALSSIWGVQMRRLRHLTALHRMEWELNRFHNQSISWHREIGNFVDKSRQGIMVFELPRQLQMDEAIGLDLIDLDTKRRIFLFHTHVSRINADFGNLEKAYRLLQENHWGGSVTADVFVVQAQKIAQALEPLDEALKALDEEALDLWARIHVRSKSDKTMILKLREVLLAVRKLSDSKVTKAREEVAAELAVSRSTIMERGRPKP